MTFLIPVYAIALGAGVLDETIAPRHWAGLAPVALGLAAIDGRLIAGLQRALNPHAR